MFARNQISKISWVEILICIDFDNSVMNRSKIFKISKFSYPSVSIAVKFLISKGLLSCEKGRLLLTDKGRTVQEKLLKVNTLLLES